MADVSPFMRMPREIRLMIYGLLFDDKENRVLEIRNESAQQFKERGSSLRTSYNVLGRRDTSIGASNLDRLIIEQQIFLNLCLLEF